MDTTSNKARISVYRWESLEFWNTKLNIERKLQAVPLRRRLGSNGVSHRGYKIHRKPRKHWYNNKKLRFLNFKRWKPCKNTKSIGCGVRDFFWRVYESGDKRYLAEYSWGLAIPVRGLWGDSECYFYNRGATYNQYLNLYWNDTTLNPSRNSSRTMSIAILGQEGCAELVERFSNEPIEVFKAFANITAD